MFCSRVSNASRRVVTAGYELGDAPLEADSTSAEPLLSSGQLDPKSFDELCASVEQRGSDTVAAMLDAYRGVVVDIERALHSPTAARQDRSTRRALRFIREHLGEPLTLPQVSRIAGFAPVFRGASRRGWARRSIACSFATQAGKSRSPPHRSASAGRAAVGASKSRYFNNCSKTGLSAPSVPTTASSRLRRWIAP